MEKVGTCGTTELLLHFAAAPVVRRYLKSLERHSIHMVDNSWLLAAVGAGTEESSRPVDGCVSGCLLTCLLLIFVGGSFEKLAVDEGGSGADEWDEVGCVDAAPPGLG